MALVWYIVFLCSFFILSIFVKLGFWVRVIWERKCSISRVPGPRLAAWSRLWIARALASGRSHEIWTEVNAKYGAYHDAMYQVVGIIK